jgi:hypothetical protein
VCDVGWASRRSSPAWLSTTSSMQSVLSREQLVSSCVKDVVPRTSHAIRGTGESSSSGSSSYWWTDGRMTTESSFVMRVTAATREVVGTWALPSAMEVS